MWGTSERAALLGESRSLLEAAIKLEPKRADAHALLAAVYWDLGQRERAMELAWRALQLEPLDATARAEMGRIYAEAGFFESAIAETSKALALDPVNLRPLGIQIVCLSWLGRQNELSEALNKFRQWYPGSLADLFTADQQLRARNFDEAGPLIASGKQSATAENRPAFDIVDGLRAAQMGNRTEATRVFDQYKNSPPASGITSFFLRRRSGRRALPFN
jgi:tetratricopeptide (TPR) repeat protein